MATQELEFKAGLNALSPEVKSAVEANIQNNQNLTTNAPTQARSNTTDSLTIGGGRNGAGS